MTYVQGVDASFDVIDAVEAQRVRQAGIEVFVQCLWTGNQQPAQRVVNLRNCKDAGLTIAGYISLSGDEDGANHIDYGRAGVPNDLWNALAFVAVDVELPGIPTHEIRAAVERCAALGKRRVIYTSYGHWTGRQGNSKDFGDCLLWNALWDQQPDIDFAGLPYGAWALAQIIGEQYSGGGILPWAQVFVDRNTFVRELVVPPSAAIPLTPPPTGAEFAALVGFVVDQKRKFERLTGEFQGLAGLVVDQKKKLEEHTH